MGTKRGHGEGTVRFIPERGIWEARFTYTDPKTGEKKRKKFSDTSQAKALRKGRKFLDGLQGGLLPNADKTTLTEWLDIWAKDYTQNRVRVKTYEKYSQEIKNYIKPGLGHLLIGKIGVHDVQKWIAELSQAGRKDGKGLSSCTVRNARRTLIMSLDDAVRAGYILRNSAKDTKPPRLTKAPINPLSKEEAITLIDAAKAYIETDDFITKAVYMAILVALNSGMRIGEVFGLKRDCIFLSQKTIAIRRELVDTTGGMVLQEWAKTSRSYRQILMPCHVIAELEQYMSEQDRISKFLGDKYDDQGYLITNSFGKPMHSSNFRSRHFVPIKNKAGITKDFTFHDLRHTHATLLLQAGINIKVIQERLGHESVTLTLDTYSHLLPSMQNSAVEALESFFTTKQKTKLKVKRRIKSISASCKERVSGRCAT